jgi:hypothetical protein
LENYDLEVRFKDGTASLSGAVDSRSQLVAACEAAAKVPGVKTVVNRLTVKGRPVSAASRNGQADPATMAQFQPYASAQSAQMAWAGQGQANPYGGGPQLAQGGQPPIRTASAEDANGHGHPHAHPHGPYPGYPGPGYGPATVPPGYGPPGHAPAPGGYPPPGPHQVYNRPNVPDHAWPAYAPYDNYAAVSYPSQYEASAFPYIGPFYPYPQVPLGWRSAQLVWDDGYWNLKFDSKTDKWWWFMNPENWH